MRREEDREEDRSSSIKQGTVTLKRVTGVDEDFLKVERDEEGEENSERDDNL